MNQILYVYAVVREPFLPDEEAIDGSHRFGVATIEGISAVYTEVAAEEFSQEGVDARSGDLEWLGAIGYRHQSVMSALMRATAVVPLRAFTLFSSAEAVRSWLLENRAMLDRALDRLAGRQEWTLRIAFEPARWSEALSRRVGALSALQREIETAPPGKAFLLRKKLEDERKRASRQGEADVMREIRELLASRLACETVAETRESREGAFPQIDLLLERDDEGALRELHGELTARYGDDGVVLGLTGPWPPYTFALSAVADKA